MSCISTCVDVIKSAVSHLWYSIKTAKRDFFAEVCATATTDNIWSINQWYRGRKTHTIPTLKGRQGLATTDEDKADVFASTFFPNANISVHSHIVHSLPQRAQLPFPAISKGEVEENLAQCHNKSSPGAFGTNYKVLKWAFGAKPDIFINLFNSFLTLGYHPKCLRSAIIAPIPKPNKFDWASPKSYRPISLLETTSKLFERIVACRFSALAGKHNLIPPEQFGGRDKTSCLDAGLSLIHDIHTSHARKSGTSAVLMDISGYYNNIDHNTLVLICRKSGFPSFVCDWLRSFLSDRNAAFRINGNFMPFFDLGNRGVPQGSPLSPVMSSLYTAPLINHLIHVDSINVRAYIDDILITCTGPTQAVRSERLAEDIRLVRQGLGDLGLVAEMEKTELIHFAKRPSDAATNLVVRLGDRAEDILHPKDCVRWLGFFLDRCLNFKQHVSRLSTRARSILGGMRMLGNTVRGLSVIHARTLINACIIPILTYGSLLWRQNRNFKSLVKPLQLVQNEACRWVTGAFRSAPVEALQHLAALPPIAFRIQRFAANFAAKLRSLPLSSHIARRLPAEFDSSSVDTAHPTPLSPINSIAAFTHPDAEFRTPYIIMPWEGLDRFDIRVERHLPDDRSKKDYARDLKRRLARDHAAGDTLELYVDGSSFVHKGCRKVGWSWILFRNGRDIASAKGAFGPRATNYDGEAWALSLGLNHALKEAHSAGDPHLHVICDNAGLIQSLFARNPKGASSAVDTSTRALIDYLSSHPDFKIELTWTPSHMGVFGNERADRLAKSGASSKPAPVFNRTSDFIRHRAKTSVLRNWNSQWCHFKRTHPTSIASQALAFPPRLKLHPFHAKPGRRRRYHTQLIRAITGHGRHAYFLHRIGSIDSPACPCGAPIQDIPHIFQSCPRHKAGRKFLRGVSKSLNLAHIFSTTKGLKAALEFLGRGSIDI